MDSLGADGMRKTMAMEFSHIYVFNLRGNQRTSGEESLREGGKVFVSGSRATVAITLAVKNPSSRGFVLKYRDIGDFLTAREKLEIVSNSSIDDGMWDEITPNEFGDWVRQRQLSFSSGIPLAGEGSGSFFALSGPGVSTNRDAWAYSFSRKSLSRNVSRSIEYFNNGSVYGSTADKMRIKWSDGFTSLRRRGIKLDFDADAIRVADYRPFSKQYLYCGGGYLDRPGVLNWAYPSARLLNLGIYISGKSSAAEFSSLVCCDPPNLHFQSSGQYFPRFTWTQSESDDNGLFGKGAALNEHEKSAYGEIGEIVDGYVREDNITGEIKRIYRDALGSDIMGDDIFHFVYGKLHDPAYRTKYAADLKKMLPHIETPSSRAEFDKFAAAGQGLINLHLNYESVEPWPLSIQVKGDESDRETWRVLKMKWAKLKDPVTGKDVDDVTKLIYNKRVTITDIPAEAHEYMIGSRSAVSWLINRYQVNKDKSSGIVNDPNDWADEVGNPRYIVDLIGRVVRVAMDTVRIVEGLNTGN